VRLDRTPKVNHFCRNHTSVAITIVDSTRWWIDGSCACVRVRACVCMCVVAKAQTFFILNSWTEPHFILNIVSYWNFTPYRLINTAFSKDSSFFVFRVKHFSRIVVNYLPVSTA
jgi:hypothetical protein